MRRAKPGATTLSGARRTAAKISDTDRLVKVGKITASVAKAAGIKAGDIVLGSTALRHIEERHSTEIHTYRLTPLTMVQYVADNFNQIRQGSGNSLLLIVLGYKGDTTLTAAIQINYSTKEGFWEIATAQPRRLKAIAQKRILYEKQRRGRVRTCP